jgi:arginine-tRNA-protein transferase
MTSQNIHLYLTSEHACGYFEGRKATNLVPDPAVSMGLELYSKLVSLGYRRSGDFTYRPHCQHCDACQPCRLPVQRFKPRRSQRRCLNHNRDLSVRVVAAQYTDEYFELYRNYINTRHDAGDMVNPTPTDFSHFLYSAWSDTFFIEIRHNKKLLAIAVTDPVQSGLSAVYNFYDPAESARGLGTFCVLMQIQHAINNGLDYLYLGYWIHHCRKMEYKADYQPMQVLYNNNWVDQRATV